MTTDAAQARPAPYGRWSALCYVTGKAAAGVLAIVPLIPVLIIARAVRLNVPGLQDYAGVILGLGATLCLLGCLAVTPVSWLARFPSAMPAASARRWLGLCVFFTGAAGLAIAELGARTGMDAGMHAAATTREWTGTLIIIILLPLAVISNQLSQRLLGTWWKIWQRRLTWAAWAAVAVHILVLGAWQTELAFAAASAPLIAARIPAIRKDIATWRRDGYADPARSLLAGLAIGVFAYGFAILTWTEVVCSAQAVRLA